MGTPRLSFSLVISMPSARVWSMTTLSRVTGLVRLRFKGMSRQCGNLSAASIATHNAERFHAKEVALRTKAYLRG